MQSIKIDPYRRNLQRAFVDILGARLTPASAGGASTAGAAPAVKDDTRAAFRAELMAIQVVLGEKSFNVADPTTKNHLIDLNAQISQILDPRK